MQVHRAIAVNVAARTLWYMPGRFQILRCLGPSYHLRCLVFHDIAERESAFTRELNVTVTPKAFATALNFITRHYNPVSLRDVLAGDARKKLPPRPLLVTFDDGYASVARWAAPLCLRYGVPATLFLNASLLGNTRLAADNLVCYVANTFGLQLIDKLARSVEKTLPHVNSLAEVYTSVFPALPGARRERFIEMLAAEAGINVPQLARDAALYLTRKEVRELAAAGFEIGSHTYSHVHCRTLSGEGFRGEIDRNQIELEGLVGGPVHSFSIPYGSSDDLTTELWAHLRTSGHEAVFLSESVANPAGTDPKRMPLDRISIHGTRADALFCEIELLPRLRAIRNRYARSAWDPERRQRARQAAASN
jgi:peptidoglycan/xylan/chitin deacetylase (PgdA/CDA1 family)